MSQKNAGTREITNSYTKSMKITTRVCLSRTYTPHNRQFSCAVYIVSLCIPLVQETVIAEKQFAIEGRDLRKINCSFLWIDEKPSMLRQF